VEIVRPILSFIILALCPKPILASTMCLIPASALRSLCLRPGVARRAGWQERRLSRTPVRPDYGCLGDSQSAPRSTSGTCFALQSRARRYDRLSPCSGLSFYLCRASRSAICAARHCPALVSIRPQTGSGQVASVRGDLSHSFPKRHRPNPPTRADDSRCRPKN